MLLVVQRDGRDRRDHRIDDVGGVETPAEPDFDDRHVHTCSREDHERRSGDDLEECGVHLERACIPQLLDGCSDRVERTVEQCRGH